MELKELLGDELYAKVDEKLQEHNNGEPNKQKHVRYADLSEGRYVSVEKYTEKETELAGVRQQLTDANKQIKSYKDMDIDGIRKSAADWEEKYKTDTTALQGKITGLQKEAAAKDYLSGKKIRGKLAHKAALAGMMELEYKDGQFVGADEYMKKLQEEDPDSFEKEKEEKETKPGSWVRGVNRKDRPSTLDADEAYLKAKYGNNKYYHGNNK